VFPLTHPRPFPPLREGEGQLPLQPHAHSDRDAHRSREREERLLSGRRAEVREGILPKETYEKSWRFSCEFMF
jgi:hypothetical protein